MNCRICVESCDAYIAVDFETKTIFYISNFSIDLRKSFVHLRNLDTAANNAANETSIDQ